MNKLKIASAHHRRKDLIHLMAQKESENIHCFRCQGDCCTSFLNSMQITPLETLDLIAYFYQTRQLDDSFTLLLKENIKAYRLDSELPGNGKRSYLRRSYTCPFFQHKTKGCGVSRSYKPYGCLAFNPSAILSVDSEHCRSNQSALKQQWEKLGDYDHINKSIAEYFKLDWEVKPVAVAILSFFKSHSIEEIMGHYKNMTSSSC